MKKNLIFGISCLIITQIHAQVSAVKLPFYGYDFLATVNEKLLFFANDGTNPEDYELWSSDGTEAGTVLVKDINPGTSGSILDNSYWGPQYTDRMPVVFNNELYFLAYDFAHGMEIWKTDGTEAGTHILKDINPGPYGFFDPEFNYPYFTELDGELFFAANDGTHGFELWKTDGSEGGTEMVKDISVDGIYGSNPEHLINFNGTLIFTARDDVYGYEIYKSDGTGAGTMIIKDIVPGINGAMNNGYASSIDPQFTVIDNYLYFTGRIDETLPVLYYLYRTDGTAAGTITLNNTLQNVTGFTNFNDDCYFYAFDGDYYNSAFWKSDGTPGGTEIIETDNEIQAMFTSRSIYNKNGSLYFYGNAEGFTKYGLCKSDGTTAGTSMIYELEGLGSVPEISNFNSEDDRPEFYCRALIKVSDFAMQNRIMQCSGSAASTIIYPGASPFRTTAFLDGDVYFFGIDTTGDENWGLFKLEPMLVENIVGSNSFDPLSIYPNPTSDHIFITLPDNIKNGEYVVYDMNGKKVIDQQNFSGDDLTLTTRSLDNGLYFIQLRTAENSYSGSFMILKE
ncbi:MAG: T9SS type A sorting domain-containing protein [Bacteroidetes bacterium]|nr:T9SS type A sorting domain-containing protein [Bacteroidota bacterium]